MMPTVFALRISRPHRKIRRFGDGWQSGFSKSALPVGGRIEAIGVAEKLSVTPHFECLGITHKQKKAARHPQMPHFPFPLGERNVLLMRSVKSAFALLLTKVTKPAAERRKEFLIKNLDFRGETYKTNH